VDTDDVLVGDLAGQQQLALEAAADLRAGALVAGDLGPDHLERHRDVQLAVPRLVHRTHAADAEQHVDAVAGPERFPDLERAALARRLCPGRGAGWGRRPLLVVVQHDGAVGLEVLRRRRRLPRGSAGQHLGDSDGVVILDVILGSGVEPCLAGVHVVVAAVAFLCGNPGFVHGRGVLRVEVRRPSRRVARTAGLGGRCRRLPGRDGLVELHLFCRRGNGLIVLCRCGRAGSIGREGGIVPRCTTVGATAVARRTLAAAGGAVHRGAPRDVCRSATPPAQRFGATVMGFKPRYLAGQ
jgi:hypothetical protein